MPTSRPPSVSDIGVRGLFVGREAERRRVARLWSRSRVVVFVGADGIGKTALVRACAAELAAGVPTWSAACGERAHVLDRLDRALGLPPLATPASDRELRIAAAVERERGILCIDDAHALGLEEARSVVRIAAELRTGRVLVTARRRIELGALGPNAAVIEVGALPIDKAVELVRTVLARLGRVADANALAERSGGSPLWCGLLAGGAERGEGGLPDRLGELASELRDAVELLATFDECVPEDWVGLSAVGARELARRFVVERSADGRVGVHAVVRAIVLAGQSEGERARRHRTCADAYRRAGADGIEGVLRHLEAAGDPAGLGDALDGSGAAWLCEARRFGDCLRLLDHVAARGVPLTARLHLRRALCLAAQRKADDAERALAAGAGATDGERALPDELVRVLAQDAIAELRGESAFLRIARREPLVARFASDAAAASTRDVSRADWGSLLDDHVRDCIASGSGERALAVCDAVARESARVDALSRANIARRAGELRSARGDRSSAVSALRDAEAKAASLGSPSLLGSAHAAWIDHHVRFGERGPAEERLRAADAVAVPSAESAAAIERELRRARVTAAAGRLGEAGAALAALAEQRAESAPAALRAELLADLASVRADAGDEARARAAAMAALSSRRAVPIAAAIRAHLAAGRASIGGGRVAHAARRARVAFELAHRGGLRADACDALLLLAEAIDVTGPTRGPATTGADLARGALVSADAIGAAPLVARAHVVSARIWLAHAARIEVARLTGAEPSVRYGARALSTARERATDGRRIGRAIGNAALEAEGQALLGWIAFVGDAPDVAARHLADARALVGGLGAARVEASVRLLDMALRARRGNRRAREALSGTAPRAGVTPLDPDAVRRLAGRAPPVLARAPIATRSPVTTRDDATALNRRERWLVRELAKRTAISNREYRIALAIPRATAHRDLEHLVRLGLLRRTGKGKSAVYRLVEGSAPPQAARSSRPPRTSSRPLAPRRSDSKRK